MLPLVSPPAMQPYALVRRVSFKSVVIMEQRGVLVAIAGRRDGVRVYALEEIKKAIEWRIDVEVRRERDKQRREHVKKRTVDQSIDFSRDSNDKIRKASLSTPPPGEPTSKANLVRKNSQHELPIPPSPPPVPLIPRSATRKARKRVSSPSSSISAIPRQPLEEPPPYAGPSEIVPPPILVGRPSLSLTQRTRGGSISNVLTQAPGIRNSEEHSQSQDDSKADWTNSSDDEAINAVASGPSGIYLDERTSATLSAGSGHPAGSPQLLATTPQAVSVPVINRTTTQTTIRRNRPSNLDLTLTRSTPAPPPEPSPAPTLLSLQQVLTETPSNNTPPNPETPFVEPDEEDEEVDGHISLAQALLESRIPDLPPIGSSRAQEPILITPSSSTPQIPQLLSNSQSSLGRNSGTNNNSKNRRRRWSIMISSPSTETTNEPPATAPAAGARAGVHLSRSNSVRSISSQTLAQRSATEPLPPVPALPPPPLPTATLSNPLVPPASAPSTSRSSRFLPRLINHVFHGRSSDERPALTSSPIEASDGNRWTSSIHHQAPPPKLEYVKLPGTKGALLIKAVETAKKRYAATRKQFCDVI